MKRNHRIPDEDPTTYLPTKIHDPPLTKPTRNELLQTFYTFLLSLFFNILSRYIGVDYALWLDFKELIKKTYYYLAK